MASWDEVSEEYRWHTCKAGGFYYSWPEFWEHKLSGECSKPLVPGQRELMGKALKEYGRGQ